MYYVYYVLKNPSVMVEDRKVRNVFAFSLIVRVVRKEGKLELIETNL